MEKHLLTNPEIVPEKAVFESALGEVFPVFEKLFSNISESEYGLTHEWRYYNDGKAWLCKAQFKNKTVFWLSIWESCFKITFYFTEKHLDRFFELPVAPTLKELLNQAKSSGKLIPLTISVLHINQLDDVMRIVEFKKSLL